MFQVELEVLVSAKTHPEQIVLWAAVQLPFAPFAGLALRGLMSDPNEPVEISSVSYDVRTRTFYCELEDDVYSAEDEEGGIVSTIEDKIAEYGETWEVTEREYEEPEGEV